MSLFYKLFACCVPVKGAKRSIICDLQRNSFLYIPNEFFDYLENNPEALMSKLDSELNEAWEYLLSKEYAYLTDNVKSFPFLSESTFNDIPNEVDTIIVDFDTNSSYDIENLALNILDIRVYAIEIRIYSTVKEKDLKKILNSLVTPYIRTCHLTLKYSESIKEEFLIDLIGSTDVIKQVIIHSSPINKINNSFYGSTLIYSKEVISNETHCGNISPSYFESNISHYKRRKVNNCLNGKISITKEGLIKNCPSTASNFGHIDSTDLRKVILNKKIKELWYISKDDIDVCKDCEFRYICVDCRAYTQNSNKYSKPKKCSYDPYANLWKN